MFWVLIVTPVPASADQLTGSGAGGISPDGSISLAPSGASLTSTSGTWTGPGHGRFAHCPGCYSLYLNGASNGTGNATEAGDSQWWAACNADNPGGWYLWNGSWVWVGLGAP